MRLATRSAFILFTEFFRVTSTLVTANDPVAAADQGGLRGVRTGDHDLHPVFHGLVLEPAAEPVLFYSAGNAGGPEPGDEPDDDPHDRIGGD